MSDTDSSFCSIHQALDGTRGLPAVVANGNGKDAGACLAVSFEAKVLGVKRGSSLWAAKKICPDLIVYESCLPLYDEYAEIFDRMMAILLHPRDCFRASTDEVAIWIERDAYPMWKDFDTTLRLGQDNLRNEGLQVRLSLDSRQRERARNMPFFEQGLFAFALLFRECADQLLGLPVSIALAPSLSLAKSLILFAKPVHRKDGKYWRVKEPGIAFPESREQARQALRKLELQDLCGLLTTARRLSAAGIRTVADVQDRCSPERLRQICRNVHQAKVAWHLCHGRDEVLPGYLAAVRDRKPPPYKNIGKGHTLYQAPQSPDAVWQLIAESCREIGEKVVARKLRVRELFLSCSGYRPDSPRGGVQAELHDAAPRYPRELYQQLRRDTKCHELIRCLLPEIRRIQVYAGCCAMDILPIFQNAGEEKLFRLLREVRRRLQNPDALLCGYEIQAKRPETYTRRRLPENSRASDLLGKNRNKAETPFVKKKEGESIS